MTCCFATKVDWEGKGLGETSFILADADYTEGSGLLNAAYTSILDPDNAENPDNGYVTTAFLRNNATYLLTETKAKKGYLGLQHPITIHVDGNGEITVSGEGEDLDFFNLNGNTLTIKNKPFTFSVSKVDKESGRPLSGARFELHEQINVGGVVMFDFDPMPGYTDDILITDANGRIPKLDETLPPGTYRLDETFAPAGYVKWSTGLIFTLNDVGKITLGSRYPDGTDLTGTPKEVDNRIFYEYILSVPNSADSKWPSLTIMKNVTGDMADYSKEFLFTITLNNVDENTPYDYSLGTETGTLTVDAKHQIQKRIKHGETLVIGRLPLNTTITVKEETGSYTTTWKKDHEEAEAVNNAISFNLADSTIVEVTNNMPAVAPTGYSGRHTPYFLLLLCGFILMMVIGGMSLMKEKSSDDDDPTKPLKPQRADAGAPKICANPVSMGGKETKKRFDDENHIRWRNSVWVGYNKGHRAIIRSRGSPGRGDRM